ncbi:RnfH family protein [Tepidicella xavieri]|nr:RnfH family protein [Tepidicella xavieri]
MQVTVAHSPAPRQVKEVMLDLPEGATVAEALQATGWPVQTWQGLDVGIWGRKAHLDTRLQPLDRVEVYRPLRVDPKVARRERFGRQGARAAGLFARRRPGGKPGY